MYVIIVKQADLLKKALGPIDCDVDEAHRVASRLRIRATQLGVSSLSTDVVALEEFDGGRLGKTFKGFFATRVVGDEDYSEDEEV